MAGNYWPLSESVCGRLRDNGFRARTVNLSGRNNGLSWFECQAKTEVPCCVDEVIAKTAFNLLLSRYSFSQPLRSLGVRACDLIDVSNGVQMSCIVTVNRKQNAIMRD